MKETRVYAIPNGTLHHSEYSDEEFIAIAERNGDVYSIKGFQDKFNCDGNYLETSSKELNRFMDLQIRFIEIVRRMSKWEELFGSL